MGKPEIRFKGYTDEWEQRKYAEVIELLSGQDFNPEEYNEDGIGIPYLTGASCIENGCTTAVRWTEKPRCIVEKGDTVLVCKGSGYGTIATVNQEKAHIARQFMALKVKKHELDYRFNYFLLNSVVENIKTDARGLIAGIARDAVLKQEIVIPCLNEQTKIGEYFDNLDKMITLHQRKCDEVKSLKKYVLQKMFPQNEQKIPEIRFEGFTEAWEQRKLGDIATFINGRAYSQDELLSSGKYKVLRVGNFYTNDSWYYSDMELDDKYYAEKGDLLYTWSATFGPHIWRGDKVIYHYHIWKIELSKALEKSFALQLLEQDKQAILSDKNGSTMVHITKAGMEGKEVLLPRNINEQAKIGNYFSTLDNFITLHQRKSIPHPNHSTTHTKHKGEEKYVRIRVNDRGKIDRTANLRRFPVDIPGRFKN